MGLLSSLNPLTFGEKHQAAWNALMAAYSFSKLSDEEQQLLLQTVEELAPERLRRPFEQVGKQNSQIVAYNFLVYGFRGRGIRPALGQDLWFHISNPFVDCIGAEEVLPFVQRQLEKQHNVQLPSIA